MIHRHFAIVTVASLAIVSCGGSDDAADAPDTDDTPAEPLAESAPIEASTPVDTDATVDTDEADQPESDDALTAEAVVLRQYVSDNTKWTITDDEIACTSASLPPGVADELYAADWGTENFAGIDDIEVMFTAIDDCFSADTLGSYLSDFPGFTADDDLRCVAERMIANGGISDTFAAGDAAFADDLESCGIDPDA